MTTTLDIPRTGFWPALRDAAAELIAPTRCGGCDAQGELFCAQCRAGLRASYDPERACPRCAAPQGALVCTECAQASFAFTQALVLGVLDGALARAIVIMKDSGEQRLAAELGDLLAARVALTWPDWADAVAYVPVTEAARRKRGFDQGRHIACALAACLQLPVGHFLTRPRSTDLRALNREQRRVEVAKSFKLGPDAQEARRYPRLLLVDDVFTTGATVQACSQLLIDAGATEVRVACLARTM
ncbi:MAG: ComF family protein [Coriobacteriia bacterium]|nr:ComF family protein [Coriobacteriia bacterium]